jgi:antitoxin HicB
MAVVTLSGASGALAGCLIGLATNIYAEKSMEPNVLLDPDKYPATLTQLDDKDGGGWLASYPDLPGCYGHGSTQAEALKDGTAAVLHWIKAHEERNLSVPPPRSNGTPSGNIRVRVPRMLQLHLHAIAQFTSTSVNALVILILGEELGLMEPSDDPGWKKTAMVSILTKYRRGGASRAPVTWSYDEHDRYGGEWVQRLEPQLHHHLRFRAEDQGVSINTLIVMLLSLGVGRREAANLIGGGDDNGGLEQEVDDKPPTTTNHVRASGSKKKLTKAA